MSAIVSGKEESVTRRTSNTERVGAFSDGVFAVIITIMVLELKPPEHPSFAALAMLWPTALSYAVSYLFIAIIWVNHHYLLRFGGRGDTAAHLVEFRASVFGVADTVFDSMDCHFTDGGGSGICLRCHLCPGEYRLPRVRV